jgi:hypothetical protein
MQIVMMMRRNVMRNESISVHIPVSLSCIYLIKYICLSVEMSVLNHADSDDEEEYDEEIDEE